MKTSKKHGDSIIEVMLAITIFSVVAVSTLSLMNSGVNAANRTLESAIARNLIETEAETLKFIHNGYVAQNSSGVADGDFEVLWKNIVDKTRSKSVIDANFNANTKDNCNDVLTNRNVVSFVLNPRGFNSAQTIAVRPRNNVLYTSSTSNAIKPAVTFPRIDYKGAQGGVTDAADMLLEDTSNPYVTFNGAQGISIIGVYSGSSSADSDYYDFYIRTCWNSPGVKVPMTQTSIVRLYNPDRNH